MPPSAVYLHTTPAPLDGRCALRTRCRRRRTCECHSMKLAESEAAAFVDKCLKTAERRPHPATGTRTCTHATSRTPTLVQGLSHHQSSPGRVPHLRPWPVCHLCHPSTVIHALRLAGPCPRTPHAFRPAVSRCPVPFPRVSAIICAPQPHSTHSAWLLHAITPCRIHPCPGRTSSSMHVPRSRRRPSLVPCPSPCPTNRCALLISTLSGPSPCIPASLFVRVFWDWADWDSQHLKLGGGVLHSSNSGWIWVIIGTQLDTIWGESGLE